MQELAAQLFGNLGQLGLQFGGDLILGQSLGLLARSSPGSNSSRQKKRWVGNPLTSLVCSQQTPVF
jgi:hypothetical protein